jgi:hypothetical protein
VELAFLVVTAKRQRRIVEQRLHQLSSAQPDGLSFTPRSHLFWANDQRTIAVGIWQDCANTTDAGRWSTSETATTWSTGHLRWRDRLWLPESEWAKRLATATQDAPLSHLVHDLAGVFIVGRAGDGRCALVSDPLAYRLMFYGESDDVAVVSSRAALAARALAREGESPPRDPFSTCWLAYSGYRITDRSGFTSVRVVPPGSVVEMEAGTGVSISGRAAAWLPTTSQQSLRSDELVELARASIAESLHAIVSLPCDRRVTGLTGGKDSRLILAVLWSEGMAREFDFVTTGPPDLPDVQIASQLAAQLGLRHVNDFPLTPPDRPYPERAREFVKKTDGMLNVWDLKDRAERTNSEVRVSGVCGEILRTYRSFRRGLPSRAELMRLYESGHTFGRLGLVRPEVTDELHGLTLEALLDYPATECEPIDLLDSFHLKHRVRFSRVGPLEELNDHLRVLPLYSIDAIRAAFALGGTARQKELLHFEIIRRCCPALVDQPFAGPGWADSLTQRRAPPPDTVTAVSKAESLMSRLQKAGFGDRKAMFQEVLLDRTNPAWDVIDPSKALDALERFAELSRAERRELFGAVTAGLWLSPDVRA